MFFITQDLYFRALDALHQLLADRQEANASANTNSPWYYSRKIDKYIFVIFTWIVWDGFMEDFAFDFLASLCHSFHDIQPRIVPFLTLILYGTIKVGAEFLISVWETFWYEEYPGIPFFEGVLTDLFNKYIMDPLYDIDFAAMTDCEDLIAFAWDLLEFTGQDQAQLIDSLTDPKKAPKFIGTIAIVIQLANRIIKRK